MPFDPEYRDCDYYGNGYDEDPPDCSCLEHLGSMRPVYCPVHEIWSDDLEIAMQEQAEKEPAPVKMGAVIEQMLTNTNRVMSAVYQAMDKKEVA